MTTQKDHLVEMILLSGHNIGFWCNIKNFDIEIHSLDYLDVFKTFTADKFSAVKLSIFAKPLLVRLSFIM